MNKSNIFWWSFLVFVFTIPLSSFVSVRVLIIVLLFSFFIKKNDNAFLVFLKRGWDAYLYMLILSLGLLYSEDKDTGGKVLETSFSFVALPIISCKLFSLDDERINKILYSFSLGLLIAGLICLLNAFLLYVKTGDIQIFFFYELTGIINFHPTYLAYYFIFSITCGLYLMYYDRTTINKIILTVVFLFFFVLLMLTGGHTAFTSLILIFSFFVLKYILEPRTKEKNVLLATMGVMVALLFLISSSDYWGDQLLLKNDYWERSDLWDAAVRANTDPLFGVGTGDDRLVLNAYYRSHGLGQFADESFNAHNQFIQVYLSNGIIGLIAVLILLGRPLYLAMREQKPLGILVFFPFIIYGMNEVFLGRYQGVVFFALTHQVFMAYYQSTQDPVFVKQA